MNRRRAIALAAIAGAAAIAARRELRLMMDIDREMRQHVFLVDELARQARRR